MPAIRAGTVRWAGGKSSTSYCTDIQTCDIQTFCSVFLSVRIGFAGIFSCLDCAEPRVVEEIDGSKTTCTYCPAGRGPNVNRTGCEACSARNASESNFFSTSGSCIPCPLSSMRVVNVERSTCSSCKEDPHIRYAASFHHTTCELSERSH